jgi:hypothetical protein
MVIQRGLVSGIRSQAGIYFDMLMFPGNRIWFCKSGVFLGGSVLTAGGVKAAFEDKP